MYGVNQRSNKTEIETRQEVGANVDKLLGIGGDPLANMIPTQLQQDYQAALAEGNHVAFRENVLKQKLLEVSVFPEEFNVPQIKSRLKVIKTAILKTKFSLEYGVDTMEPTTALAKAYNAFRNQFRVIINSRLDTTLIINENE